jgi:GH18 family chitinase
MSLKNFNRRKGLIGKICSVALSLVMIVNLMCGYVAVTDVTSEEVKAATTTSASTNSTPQYRNVMYYGEWSIYSGQNYFYPSYIDGSLITHLNFAFLDVDSNGDLVLCDEHADFLAVLPEQQGLTYGDPYAGVLGAMSILRSKYPNMKIGISVGGWTRSGDFSAVAADPAKRKNFATNIAKFVDYLGYDFVDIDWEYPTAVRESDPEGNGVTIDEGCPGTEADTQNYTLLLQEIRSALDDLGKENNKYYELSVAMSASPTLMSKIEYDKVLDIVDFANMMTYDLNGAWNSYTGHQTALYTNDSYDSETQSDGQYSVDTCVSYLEDTYGDSIDYSKIVIGVAPYTRGWAGVQDDGKDADNPGLYATAEPNSVKAADGTTSGTFAYGAIDSLISKYNLKEYYDEKAEAAYYYSAETGYFFTCDNERSVAAKGKYVKEKKLGGLISWMASLDSANSLTQVMYDSLYGDEELEAQEIKTSNPDVSATITASGSQYTITLKNNESQTESNTALKDAELFKKTVTYPKLYIKSKSGATFSAGSEAGQVTNQDGYGVIDLSSVYAGKTIKPGASHTFTINVTGSADVSDIESITMTRRILTSLDEFGTQVVYGAGDEQIPSTTASATVTTTAAEQSAETTKQTAQTTTTEKTTTTATAVTTTTASNANVSTYPVWSAGTAYSVGDYVYYEGKVYKCTYAHTGQSDWSPTAAPTLWTETDLKGSAETTASASNSTSTTTQGSSENKETEKTENNYTVNGTLPQHMVTGYWHNFVNGSTNLKLSDVPTYYDMICVAFTGNTSVPGEVTFELDSDLSKALGGYSKEEFIQDIKDLKAKGQHVIISVGGAEGRIDINSDTAAETFAEGLIQIIEEYGFEGVDIDLEGSAVTGVDYIAEALRTVHDHFGDDFIITMAPETYYIQADRLSSNDITTAYLRLALSIKDILTICYPQYYNSGSMNGYGGTVVSPGTADFYTSLSTLILEAGLRADQVAIGVPSTASAGGGYASTDVVKTAVNSLIYGTSSGSFTPPKAYPTLRGVMTWSINWDATNNYQWAKEMSALMDELPTTEQTTTAQATTKKEETTTTQKVTENTTTQKESETQDSNVNKPIEVIGLVLSGQSGADVTFVWGQNEEQMSLGQSYNVYADGEYVATYNSATQVKYTFTTNGSHTIKVTAVLNGYETEGQTIAVQVSGLAETATTEASVTEKATTTEANTTEKTTQAEETTKTTTNSSLSSKLLIGYYHTWDNSGNPFIKLRDVDSNWDVINISFAEPVSAGSTDGKMQFNISGLSDDYTKEDFKKDVKDLQAKGKKIVLSIGGYEGYFSLTSQTAVNQFVSDIKGIIDEYGFDGIDIDLEQSSVQFDSGNDPDINNPTSPKVVNMIQAIRTICSSYGDDFILSWAPETFYVQLGYSYYGGINQYCDSRAGVYLPMINALRDITTYVHVQLYNSTAITGLDGQSYNMGTKEGIVAMCEMLLKGFNVGAYYTNSTDESTYFAPLRPDQVVIGVPSSVSAAGSGQISNEQLQAAFTELNNKYPGIRGIMTWSINWDSSQNNNSFAQENQQFLSTLRDDAEEETTTVEETTKEVIPETTTVVENTTPETTTIETTTQETTTPEATTIETTTQETDKNEIVISDDVKVEGYQVSATLGGVRTIGSVENTINNKSVEKWGFVYALEQNGDTSYPVTDDDMFVGSENEYVASMESTEQGTVDIDTGSDSSTVFVRTILFAAGSKSEFCAGYKVRVYALLEDGSYVYSKVYSYSIFDIADNLYKNQKMNNLSAHNYLYNSILKVVDASYKEVDYNWQNEILKPDYNK